MDFSNSHGLRALLIGDVQDYFVEHLGIEGISYLFSSGGVRNIKDNQFQLVVLIQSKLEKGDSNILEDYVNQGGNLLIVNPFIQVCRLFNFDIKGSFDSGYLTCNDKNFPVGFYPIMNAIRLKINKKYKPVCSLFDENKNPTNYDSIFKINISKGNIGVIAFDLLKTLYHITHGKDVTYKNSLSPILRVDEGRIIAESEMNLPAADILRSILINIILDFIYYPVPKLWYFPDGCRSALCVTHDSDNANSQDIVEINKIDLGLKIHSTTFMSIFNGGIKSWRMLIESGLDLQFHPVQFYKYHPGRIIHAIQRAVGSTKLFLKFQKIFFNIQKKLFDFLNGKKTSGIRFHGLLWNKLTDQPLWMSLSKIHFDSTLGSNCHYGYPYGTGLPFFLRHPEKYQNLNVLEVPMHIMDSVFVKKHGPKKWIKFFFMATKKLISNADLKFFSLTVLNLHHYILLDSLDPLKTFFPKNNDYSPKKNKTEVLESYRDLMNYSKRLNVKIESMSYFNDFWRKRQKVHFTRYLWDRIKKELSYQIAIKDNCYIYSQILPFKFKKLQLKEIFIDEEKSDFKRIFIYNNPYAIFEVKKGPINLNVKANYA